MILFNKIVSNIDAHILPFMKRYGLSFLRLSLALIFIWFGTLKIIHYSPATELVTRTVYWFNPVWFVPFLGWWEVLIGACFLFKKSIRLGILLLAPQMAGTFLPLILLPHIVYQHSLFFLPTLEGQYIIKNLLIIGAALVIGAHLHDRDSSYKKVYKP